MSMADTMVSGGYLAAGYNRINIDDCWMATSRVDGKLVADKERFPHAIPYLADYVSISYVPCQI